MYIQYQKAEESYQQVLSLKAENLTANFNLAMLYTDKANFYYREINQMSHEAYKKLANDYEQKALNLIRKALPLMEKAEKTSPKNKDILNTLIVYYDRLGMSFKKREAQQRLSALGG